MGTTQIDTTTQQPFEIVSVSLDEGPSYNAYSRGERWNGWHCPYFTLEEAMRLAAHPHLKGLKYEAEKDQFVLNDPAYANDSTYEAEIFTPQTITVDGQQIKVYAIGAFGWCWNKDDSIDSEIAGLKEMLEKHGLKAESVPGSMPGEPAAIVQLSDGEVLDEQTLSEEVSAAAHLWSLLLDLRDKTISLAEFDTHGGTTCREIIARIAAPTT